MATFAMTITLSGTLPEVKERVQKALKAQGFGILTEINMQQTLADKIGMAMEPYLILGACNPHLASQAINVERAIGLLLPCNVVLRVVNDAVEVSILDPEVMFSVVDAEAKEQLSELPGETKRLLQNALTELGG